MRHLCTSSLLVHRQRFPILFLQFVELLLNDELLICRQVLPLRLYVRQGYDGVGCRTRDTARCRGSGRHAPSRQGDACASAAASDPDCSSRGHSERRWKGGLAREMQEMTGGAIFANSHARGLIRYRYQTGRKSPGIIGPNRIALVSMSMV